MRVNAYLKPVLVPPTESTEKFATGRASHACVLNVSINVSSWRPLNLDHPDPLPLLSHSHTACKV